MPTQAAIDADPSPIDGTVTDSFTGPARFLQLLAPLIEARGGGTVVGAGSVAGDRGRIGNYVCGAAKAGFHTYLSGLGNRLTRAGGHVVTVKPGFVDTSMTWACLACSSSPRPRRWPTTSGRRSPNEGT